MKVYLLLCPYSCLGSCLCKLFFYIFGSNITAFLFAKCKFKMTVNVVSWFGKEQNNLVSQSKLFKTIWHDSLPNYWDQWQWRHDIPNYLTTMNNDFELHYRWAELVTLAPGLRPERRFAPLARGILQRFLRQQDAALKDFTLWFSCNVIDMRAKQTYWWKKCIFISCCYILLYSLLPEEEKQN